MVLAEISMPQLGVNDDRVKLHRWKVGPGQKVTAGEEVAELETTKATFQLEVEISGYLYPVVESGQEVPVQSILAIILDQPDEAAVQSFQARASKHPDLDAKNSAIDRTRNVQLTAKAREIVERTGVDVSGLPADRVIRERDVLDILEKQVPARNELSRDPKRVVVVYGASMGGTTLVEAIRAMGGYEVVAFLDDTAGLIGGTVFGLPVWSGQELETLGARGIGALASHIAVREFRLKLRDRAAAAGLTILNIIHPTAFVSPSVQMGVGNLIKAGAVVDTEVRLGDCCIVDNGVIVPHHNVLHDACHLAPGVSMGGGCSVGALTLLGVGSVVSPRTQIGRNVIARPGSVVVNDIPDDVVIGGNPAKVLGRRR
jgi:sugar O-acyltransferase (sialic acid O-acetyltransferase NeuD family)